jgi:hypothetical protein
VEKGDDGVMSTQCAILATSMPLGVTGFIGRMVDGVEVVPEGLKTRRSSITI